MVKLWPRRGKIHLRSCTGQCRIQDFPEVGANARGTFARKLHENEKIGLRGQGTCAPPIKQPKQDYLSIGGLGDTTGSFTSMG